MTLHFKHGALTSRQCYSAERFLENYPYAAYFSKWPNTDNLKEHDRWHEPDMGHGYVRKTKLFGCINDMPNGHILFFCFAREDYQKVIAQKDILIDANPFETSIQDTRPKSIKQLEADHVSALRIAKAEHAAQLNKLKRLSFRERLSALFDTSY